MGRTMRPPQPTGRPLERLYVLAANSTQNGFVSKIPTATEPTGVTIALDPFDTTLRLLPFAIGANDSTASYRAIGWRQINIVTSTIPRLWIPYIVCEFSAVFSTAVGVATGPVLDTERFADAVTLVTGQFLAPPVTANTPIEVLIDVQGYQKIEIITSTGGSATSVNTLYAR